MYRTLYEIVHCTDIRELYHLERRDTGDIYVAIMLLDSTRVIYAPLFFACDSSNQIVSSKLGACGHTVAEVKRALSVLRSKSTRKLEIGT